MLMDSVCERERENKKKKKRERSVVNIPEPPQESHQCVLTLIGM